MESSRTLVAPGLRTVARLGWRDGLASAVSIVTGQPKLWLLGMIGFSLRGGILLLLLPIIVLPTQVEVRLLLGHYLGSSGFTQSFFGLLVVLAAFAALLTVGALLILARIELSSFERVIADPEIAARTAYKPVHMETDARRRLYVRLFAVQLLTLVALIACAVPVASSVIQASYAEVTLPTSAAPIYERVLGTVGELLFFFLIALIVIEMISSLTSRELLVRAFGWRERASSRRLWLIPAIAAAVTYPFRSPFRSLGTSVVAWTLSAAVVISSVWVLSVAWAAVRGAFLTSVSFSDVSEDAGMLLAALGLSTVFVLAICLTGFASALRAALWSVDRLR